MKYVPNAGSYGVKLTIIFEVMHFLLARCVCRVGELLGVYEPSARVCGAKNSEPNHFVIVQVLIKDHKHHYSTFVTLFQNFQCLCITF